LLYLFSPIIRTLYYNFEDQTVIMMFVVISGYHLLFGSYDFNLETNPDGVNLSSKRLDVVFLSFSLASRLQTYNKVFTLIYMSIAMFFLFPYLRFQLRTFTSKNYYRGIFLSKCIIGILLYHSYGYLYLIYLSTIVFIDFLCPFWLIWLQKYKMRMQGNWDIPKVKQYYAWSFVIYLSLIFFDKICLCYFYYNLNKILPNLINFKIFINKFSSFLIILKFQN